MFMQCVARILDLKVLMDTRVELAAQHVISTDITACIRLGAVRRELTGVSHLSPTKPRPKVASKMPAEQQLAVVTLLHAIREPLTPWEQAIIKMFTL